MSSGSSASSADLARAVRGSSLAELAWTDPDGAPDGCGVVALWWRDAPAVAFTYAAEARARAVASAPSAALCLTEARSTGTTFSALALIGRPRLVEDVDGGVFVDELLDEELRRYPPARKFAGSVMLRREHWWYLPRLVLSLDVRTVHPLPARASADEHVLVTAPGAETSDRSLEAHVVRPRLAAAFDPATPGGPVALSCPGDEPLPVGPAAMLGQDASFPDLEQWSTWCFRGLCDGAGLRLTQPAPLVGLPAVPSMWQRLRSQHAFGRACRAGIARAESRR